MQFSKLSISPPVSRCSFWKLQTKEACLEKMENPITAKFCNNQPWFVLLVFFVFCFELLCFDYSAITGGKTGVTIMDNNHAKAISTQNSPSHDFTEISNDTIYPLLNSPPVNVVVNKTDEANKKADREEELKVETEVDSCLGRYIFVHDLPSRFNNDLAKNCRLLTRGTDKNMCPYLENLGFGHQIENPENILLNSSWFLTSILVRSKVISTVLEGVPFFF